MIDLHIHTNHSDGTDTVQELFEKANAKNIEIISITDHDSVDAYFELEKNLELRKLYNGKIIVGSEIKTSFEKVPIEILAYGIDYKKIKIHKIDMDKMQKEILQKMKMVCNDLGLKYDEENTYIDRKDSTKQFGALVMGTELLKHEENREIISKIGEFEPSTFFRVHQSNSESPFYFDETNFSININELISEIHKSGGLAFLAHGFVYPFKNKVETIEKILTTTDIDGMECIYPIFSNEERKIIFELCKKYNKFTSGGTDYHAKNKPNIDLGTGINNNMLIEKEFISNWLPKVKLI